jgi:hypothetical protein
MNIFPFSVKKIFAATVGMMLAVATMAGLDWDLLGCATLVL